MLADRGTWLSFRNRGDLTILVEGDFPGGRVQLDHAFTQERSGLISALSITAA